MISSFTNLLHTMLNDIKLYFGFWKNTPMELSINLAIGNINEQLFKKKFINLTERYWWVGLNGEGKKWEERWSHYIIIMKNKRNNTKLDYDHNSTVAIWVITPFFIYMFHHSQAKIYRKTVQDKIKRKQFYKII